jgi:hypothetical protein
LNKTLTITIRKTVEAIKYRSCRMFFMLSKTEQEFLRDPARFNSNYQRSLRHRLKLKAEKMRSDLSVVESCSAAAEFCNNGKSPNHVASVNQGGMWSLRRDLDPRPLPYQGNAPPG